MGATVERPGSRDLAELYRRHVPEAVRLAYLMTGDHMTAEDIAQDAFVRVAGRFKHLRDPQAFPAYLRRTVMNLAKNHFRHRDIERAHARKQGEAQPYDGDPDLVTREVIRTTLFGLPYRQRAAIVLHYYEDLPEQRVAELLKCRPGTVKSLLSRGLHAMREAIGSSLEGERG